MDTDLVIEHWYFFELTCSSGAAHWCLLWYFLFDILNIISVLAFNVANLMPVHNMHTYYFLDKLPEKELDQKI